MTDFLFIQAFLLKDYNRLQDMAFILVIFYICILVAISIDLASGVEIEDEVKQPEEKRE